MHVIKMWLFDPLCVQYKALTLPEWRGLFSESPVTQGMSLSNSP